MCGRRYESGAYITKHAASWNHCFKDLTRNSEANASEYLADLENRISDYTDIVTAITYFHINFVILDYSGESTNWNMEELTPKLCKLSQDKCIMNNKLKIMNHPQTCNHLKYVKRQKDDITEEASNEGRMILQMKCHWQLTYDRFNNYSDYFQGMSVFWWKKVLIRVNNDAINVRKLRIK